MTFKPLLNLLKQPLVWFKGIIAQKQPTAEIQRRKIYLIDMKCLPDVKDLPYNQENPLQTKQETISEVYQDMAEQDISLQNQNIDFVIVKYPECLDCNEILRKV